MHQPIFPICLTVVLAASCNKHQNPQPVQEQKVTQIAKVDSVIGSYVGLKMHITDVYSSSGPNAGRKRDTTWSIDTVQIIRVSDSTFNVDEQWWWDSKTVFIYNASNSYSKTYGKGGISFVFYPSNDSLSMGEGGGTTTGFSHSLYSNIFTGKK